MQELGIFLSHIKFHNGCLISRLDLFSSAHRLVVCVITVVEVPLGCSHEQHTSAIGQRCGEEHLPRVVIDRSGARGEGGRQWDNELRRGQLEDRADARDDRPAPGDHAELAVRPLEEPRVHRAVLVQIVVELADEGHVAAVVDPRLNRVVEVFERAASGRRISRTDHAGNMILGVRPVDTDSQANVSLAVAVRNDVHALVIQSDRSEETEIERSAARRVPAGAPQPHDLPVMRHKEDPFAPGADVSAKGDVTATVEAAWLKIIPSKLKKVTSMTASAMSNLQHP